MLPTLATLRAGKATEINRIDPPRIGHLIMSTSPKQRQLAITNHHKRSCMRVQSNSESSHTKWQPLWGSTSMLTSNHLCIRVRNKSQETHPPKAVLASLRNAARQPKECLQRGSRWRAWAIRCSNAKSQTDKVQKTLDFYHPSIVSNKDPISSWICSSSRTHSAYRLLLSTILLKNKFLPEVQQHLNNEQARALIDMLTSLTQGMSRWKLSSDLRLPHTDHQVVGSRSLQKSW